MRNIYHFALIALALCSLASFPARAQIRIENRTAVFAGGCFWSMESDFDKLNGVVETVDGYTGGSIENPTYETYHDGPSPHVEAVKVTYDPARLSYEQLVDYYFHHIDPTDGGGQFCDRGPAYAPAIFTGDETEKTAAEAAKAKAAAALKQDIAVSIRPAATFWPAEDYHQGYAAKNPDRYNRYREGCGRDKRVKNIWGMTAH